MLQKLKLEVLDGIGPARARRFGKLGVQTVADLLLLAPRRYEDWTKSTPINELEEGVATCVHGRVVSLNERRTGRRNLVLTSVEIDDGTGRLEAIWFSTYRRGGSFTAQRLRGKDHVALLGAVGFRGGRPTMNSPEIRLQSEEGPQLQPVYPLTEGISQAVVRKAVNDALEQYGTYLQEFIPESVCKELNLVDRAHALRMLHAPRSLEEVERAWYRLAFEEVLCLQLILLRRQRQESGAKGITHRKDGSLVTEFLNQLPFEPTGAQKRAMNDIREDMERPLAMRRLLQGDVGSGKTLVAVYAICKAVAGGYQTAFMVPTEVLAEQHFSSLEKSLRPLGISVRLLTGRVTGKERKQLLEELADGILPVVVGTHALIQGDVEFKSLGLVVIDEQHRFGVEQRNALAYGHVDMLVMTATPIPRTMALTLYGDMDVSIIDEMPPGRHTIDTRRIAERDRPKLYQFLRKEIAAGRQAYIVYPLIEESEEISARAAVSEAERLQKLVFPDLQVGLLHGQMPYQEKDAIMQKFYSGKVHILVSTTVIEVGVDVPNASIMVIENAERFGLSQLHQLRGRVGRGPYQSYCFLLGNPTTDEGVARLNTMREVSDGFRIAEADLALRGPGELLGQRQSGFLELKFAKLTDVVLLETARKTARDLVGGSGISPALELELTLRSGISESKNENSGS